MEKAYQEALDYLYGFVDYSLTHNFPAPENFDLDRLRSFLSHFGNPHLTYPVIHVAGSKGKGSVAAMCASVLRAGGYRVGLYTSPHMSDYAERIQLDGEPIRHSDLVALVDEVRPILDRGTKLTTFEITTALALLYFFRSKANAVVAEVGLGGRLDATNVVQPLVTVITSISYDHTAVLGDTLAEIAGEKGGIIKKSVPVVVAPQKDEALRVIQKIAVEHDSPLVQVGLDYHYKSIEQSVKGQVLKIWSAGDSQKMQRYLQFGELVGWEPVELFIPLLGAHQADNAATAYATMVTARENGMPISDEAISSGFEDVVWPGRFEILQLEPPVVIDSAHNRDFALKLRMALDDIFPGREVILLFGASHDKNIDGMLAELMPRGEGDHILAFLPSTRHGASEPGPVDA